MEAEKAAHAGTYNQFETLRRRITALESQIAKEQKSNRMDADDENDFEYPEDINDSINIGPKEIKSRKRDSSGHVINDSPRRDAAGVFGEGTNPPISLYLEVCQDSKGGFKSHDQPLSVNSRLAFTPEALVDLVIQKGKDEGIIPEAGAFEGKVMLKEAGEQWVKATYKTLRSHIRYERSPASNAGTAASRGNAGDVEAVSSGSVRIKCQLWFQGLGPQLGQHLADGADEYDD